ncbi:hypothetical protein HJC23_011718 [Cyclotella cryptica]|uniref:Strictosidine synthase conserved region domain-containing protein n=1 Tax=Cyclotella cryptica TaxID=29204 RepID=A0ABD3QLV4_9STRA|eukprot:CCRYP_004849-RA/>CCRYP_004849-RA protein AED:0.29 eAED:0.29 QI:0/-1/0/1/-1/1/1/0/416
MFPLTTFAIIAIIIAVAIPHLSPHLLPYGPAFDVPPNRGPHLGPRLDPLNTSLRLSSGKLTKIFERIEDGARPLVMGPETVVFDPHGKLYILNEYAQLVTLTDIRETDKPFILTARAIEVAHLGVGRPLSGKFDRTGCLYFTDVVMGLARICLTNNNESDSHVPPVEILTSRVQLNDGSWSPINFADDIDIGPRTGHIYFSDACDVRSERDGRTGRWDIMYPSKVEGIRWNMSGRLLRYKPETGEVDVLATGASFGNGVAVDKDEKYVLFTSTFDRTVMKYHIQGEKAGQIEKILDQFPGLVDGVDCSFQSGKCYVAIPTAVSPSQGYLFSLPLYISKLMRTFLLMLPRNATPNERPYGGFAEINSGNEDAPPGILRVFQDPDGRDIDFVTGVTEHAGKVYLGSLHNDFIGVYSLT